MLEQIPTIWWWQYPSGKYNISSHAYHDLTFDLGRQHSSYMTGSSQQFMLGCSGDYQLDGWGVKLSNAQIGWQKKKIEIKKEKKSEAGAASCLALICVNLAPNVTP